MSTPRCGTRAAIVAHLEFNEPLDGPCAALDAAMRLEAERWRTPAATVRGSAEMRADRLDRLEIEVAAWEQENPAFDNNRKRPKLRSA